MKLHAIVSTMAADKKIQKVYIIGQDYSHGQQVSRITKELIKEKLPGAQVVGDELHPLAKVKDFAPYVAKIQASGADTVVTGNWGSDLALLVRAAHDAGLKVNFYTFYAGVVGGPSAIGEAGVERVKMVSYYQPSDAPKRTAAYIDDFKKKYGETEDPYTMGLPLALEMLQTAMTSAKSTEPAKVAKALEGMKLDGYFGPVEMRAQDHQLIQPLFVGEARRPGDGAAHDLQDGASIGRETACRIHFTSLFLSTTWRRRERSTGPRWAVRKGVARRSGSTSISLDIRSWRT
jgi:branched-chain amino acid transport system substrate-binding protein